MNKVRFLAATSLLFIVSAASPANAAQRKAQTPTPVATAPAPQTTVAPAPAAPVQPVAAPVQNQPREWWRNGADKVGSYTPDFLAGLLILGLGICIAFACQSIAWRLLPRTGLDELLHRHGLIAADVRAERKPTEAAVETVEDYPFADHEPHFYFASDVLSQTLFWVVLLLTSVQVARSWHLDSVANGLARVAAYLPHLFAAIAIFIATIVVADWVAHRVAAGQFGSSNALITGGVRAVVLTIGGFLSLRELQIAPDIVKIAFTLVLGSIALAVALAFGLGARGVAEQVTTDAYQNARGSARTDSAAFNKAA